MEKYGTIPPRFSAAWWEHYLYYYKFHIAVVAFLVFMFGSIIYSNVTRTHYDLHFSYIGMAEFGEEKEAALTEYFSTVAEDITGNGKKEVSYLYYNVENVMEDDVVSEYEYALQMKLVAELQGGDGDLYVLSEANTEELAGFGENFMNAYDVAGKNFPADKVKCDANGYPFAVSIAGNPVLEAAGINTSDMYVAVRLLYEGHADDEEKIAMHENSLKAARLLIGE